MVLARGRLRVGLAVRHRLLREGLQRLLEAAGCEVVGAADAAEAAELSRSCGPDVLLLGICAPLAASAWTFERLRREASPVRVLLIAEDAAVPPVAGAILAGARGVLAPDAKADELVRALRAVAHGEYWVGHESVFDVLERLQELTRPEAEKPAASLTARELQVVAAVAGGESNREIAARLGIAEATVKVHVTSIYNKLGVSNRAELTALALARGLAGRASGRRSDTP